VAISGISGTGYQGQRLYGTGTNYNYMQIDNTGGNVNFGVESSSGGSLLSGTSAYATVLSSYTNTALHFGTNNTLRATIDSSGNVGIAAIPSGEAAAAHVVRLGDRVCISEYDDGSNPEQFNLFHNSDSSETYIETGTASVIQQRAGEMVFYNAASGTAGAAISWAQHMKIGSTGAMTRPNHPCFDVTTSTASTTGTIAFNTVNIDNNSNYSTSNGRFTAPVAGSYMFYTQYIKQNSNTVMRRRFDKNGAAALNGREIRLDTGNNYGYGSMTMIIDLAAGDYVTVNQHEGTAHGGETYEAFGGHLIG
jgi:hypothetical protein